MENTNYTLRYHPALPLSKVVPDSNIGHLTDHVDEYNRDNDNYYERMKESIKKDGLHAPLLVSIGGGDISQILRLLYTGANCPYIDFPFHTFEDIYNNHHLLNEWHFLNCERGSSRYYTLSRLGITHARAIVLDFNDTYPDLEVIKTKGHFISKYHKQSSKYIENIQFNKNNITYYLDHNEESNSF